MKNFFKPTKVTWILFLGALVWLLIGFGTLSIIWQENLRPIPPFLTPFTTPVFVIGIFYTFSIDMNFFNLLGICEPRACIVGCDACRPSNVFGQAVMLAIPLLAVMILYAFSFLVSKVLTGFTIFISKVYKKIT